MRRSTGMDARRPLSRRFWVSVGCSLSALIGCLSVIQATPAGAGPADVRYVAPTGSDGADGSLERPWRTLGHAVDAVPAGGTIMLRAGTYREQVEAARTVTIKGYPGEQAWLSGGDVVTGWVPDGTAWRRDGWTASFARTEYDPRHYNSSFPLFAWPDMVFVDSNPLTQVASRTKVATGTFFVDYQSDRLYIGTNPSGRVVEASTRSRALKVSGPGSVVADLGVKQYANTTSDLGAVLVTGDGVTVDGIVVMDSAAVGMSVFGDTVTVRRSLLMRNGLAGLHGDSVNGFVAERNWLFFNNFEHFAAGSSNAGLKLTASSNVTWRGNVAEWNDGNGLWCDRGCAGVVAVGNTARLNSGSGILFEMSSGGLLASNLAYWNFQSGIYVLESKDVEIWNNTLEANTRDLTVMDGYRSAVVQSVTIRNNVLSGALPGTVSQLGVIDINDRRTAAQMGVTSNYNAYYRRVPGEPTWLSVWADGATRVRAINLADVTSETGQDASSLYAVGGSNPFIADIYRYNATRPSGSAATGAGQALPAHVAQAIGWSVTSPVDIGVLVVG